MRVDLSDRNWKLMGHWPYTPLFGHSMETGGELMGVTDWIDARVPGSVHADLLRAGLIEDPYVGMNSLRCEWVENRWWQYRVRFPMPEGTRTERVTLEFMGADYAARFYLNGEFLGRHEGMFDPAVYDVTALLREENLVDVLIESAPQEHSQIGYTSQTRTQKSRFNYKWDFGTRLVNLGLWDDVRLNMTGPYRLSDLFLRTDLDEDGRGLIRVSGAVDGLCGRGGATVTVAVSGHGFTAEARPTLDASSARFDCEIAVDDPALWQVNGLGGQPLYDVDVRVEDEKGVSDSWRGRAGIRRVRYRRNDGAPVDSLPYTVLINDRPVYLKGVNMTPLCHMYGALRREDYARVLAHARNMGVTLIRVWGGGLIEKEWFYDLCDEMGILVWQEFIQSSSGIDNVPSRDPRFLGLLETAARAALTRCRSHVSHTIWSGGNELMDLDGVPVTYGDTNIALLRSLCRALDPDKLFLPTSASGPSSGLRLDRPGLSHDIHGNWKYEGIPEHYRRYNASDSLLQSEFGCEGLSSPEGIERVMPEGHRTPTDMRRDLVWRHHGEWWDCYDRDTALFGPLKDLESWSMLSQFIQAEALRYILEANRRRKFRNSGSFIWQLNEPWPNVSCTCLIEYDGTPKMAAAWVKKAYAPVSLSARYESLVCPAGQPLSLELYLHNALDEAEFDARAALFDIRGQCLAEKSWRAAALADAATGIGAFAPCVPAVEQGILILELSVCDRTGRKVFINHLLFTQREQTPFGALQSLPRTSLTARREGGALHIRNDGDCAALFVHPISLERGRPLLLDDSHIVLMPGAARRIALASLDGGALPPIALRALNADCAPVS